MSANQSPLGMGQLIPEVFSTSIMALVLVASYTESHVWKDRVLWINPACILSSLIKRFTIVGDGETVKFIGFHKKSLVDSVLVQVVTTAEHKQISLCDTK